MDSTEPIGEEQLKAGLLAAFGILLGDAGLGTAVGESGHVRVQMTVSLDKGRVRATTGAIFFERKFRLKE